MGTIKKRRRRWRKWAAGVGLVCLAFVAASFYVELRHADRIVAPESVPPMPVALVFGAGLAPGGQPSSVLAQRLDAAIGLYRAGKVRKLLVSGDNTDRYHDETRAMRRYALRKGVPAADVVGDDAGLSTYDSCYRARESFAVERAVLVTQAFHLPRALYIANSLGIDAWGVAADADARFVLRYEVRELFSRVLALGMVALRVPARTLGERTPIEAPPGGIAGPL